MTVIPGHCIMLDGHDVTRDQTLAAARAELAARAWGELDIDEVLAGVGLVRRAWWGGDAGFVQPHHADARPVTVVNVSVDKE